jgi:hypothetical protein
VVVTTTQPPPTATFSSLTLSVAKCTAPNATADATLAWKLTKATGVRVGIDDTNINDASPYAGASGTEVLTATQCSGGTVYTFDVWTTGGTNGTQAHAQKTFTSPK